MAGDEGFEPPILGPEPSALPLGQSPITESIVPQGAALLKQRPQTVVILNIMLALFFGLRYSTKQRSYKNKHNSKKIM